MFLYRPVSTSTCCWRTVVDHLISSRIASSSLCSPNQAGQVRFRSGRSMLRPTLSDHGFVLYVRRIPRRRTSRERQFGASSDYTGTDLFFVINRAGKSRIGRFGGRTQRARPLLEPSPRRPAPDRESGADFRLSGDEALMWSALLDRLGLASRLCSVARPLGDAVHRYGVMRLISLLSLIPLG